MKNVLKHRKVLGVKVTVSPKDQLLDFISTSLKKKEKFFISTPNPEILVRSQKDSEFRMILNSADIALPDGTGLSLAGVSSRIPGRVFFEELLDVSAAKGYKIYLLGSESDINRRAVEKVAKIYPGVKVRGMSGPNLDQNGYAVTDSDIKVAIDVLDDIDKFNPDLLFVAFGAPKQEKWIYHNLGKLKIGGAMAVGGTFDYFVGNMIKPPRMLEKVGLEWFWRLIQEPKRLGRIFNAVVVFSVLVARERFRLDGRKHPTK